MDIFSLETFIKAIKAIGATTAQIPEVAELINVTQIAINPKDRETAASAYGDLIADNAAGYARLDAKLAEATLKE